MQRRDFIASAAGITACLGLGLGVAKNFKKYGDLYLYHVSYSCGVSELVIAESFSDVLQVYQENCGKEVIAEMMDDLTIKQYSAHEVVEIRDEDNPIRSPDGRTKWPMISKTAEEWCIECDWRRCIWASSEC